MTSDDLDTTWFDDDGELTELDESDEEDELMSSPPPQPPPRAPSPVPDTVSRPRSKATRASTQKATDKSRARGGLKNAALCLKPPRTTNYSASSLFVLEDWIQDGLVELNPEYQRGVVWNDMKQSALISSIICNYYVPPIVFTVLRSNDGRETRVCIDGKQRLTSIKRFMLGEIAYKDATTNRKAYFTSPDGAKRKLVADPIRSNFKNKQITCVEYEDLTGEQEREIFQRVQLGVTLAPADRLPAINGPYANLVRALRRRIETTKGFELYLNWGVARGKDFQALAQIVYLVSYGQQPNKAEPTATRLETFLSNQAFDASLQTLQDLAINVMDIFCRISGHPDLGRPIRKNLTPLEFVMASYLVYLHRKKLSDLQLSEAMGRMRREFAKACPDKKSNTKNFKFIMSFVQKEVPKLYPKLTPRLPSEKTAYETVYKRVEIDPSQSRRSKKETSEQPMEKTYPSATGSKITGKRKRVDEESLWSDSDVFISKKATKPKTEVKTQPTVPSEAGMPLMANTESAPKRKRGRPPKASAQTVVKKSASSSVAVEKKMPMGTQVGKPSVRPPPSCRNSSLSAIVNTAQVSVTGYPAKLEAPPKAGPSTSSAMAVKKPSPATSITLSKSEVLSKFMDRPPLPGRMLARTLESAEIADLAPASASASAHASTAYGTPSSSSATPVYAPQTQAPGQAQAQVAPATRTAPQEVRNNSQVAPRSPITNAFHAACASSTTPTNLNSTGGLHGRGRSASSNNVNVVVGAQNGRAGTASIMGQGQRQGRVQEQGSLAAMGGTSMGANAGMEATRFLKFNKTVPARVDGTGMGQSVMGQMANSSNQPQQHRHYQQQQQQHHYQQQQQALISRPINSTGNYTTQRSASLVGLPYANVNAAQAEKARSASTGSIWTGALATPTSTPSASPNIPEPDYWRIRTAAASPQAAPTRDPRIVVREAAAQAAKLQQEEHEQQRQVQQLQHQQHRRAEAAIIVQRQQPTRPLTPPPSTHAGASCIEGVVHPSNRSRSSQYPGGL